MPLDDTDRALLALLRDNARASTAELARKLDLARTTVQSRLARLEQSRTVVGYTVVVPDEAEAALVRAHVLITARPKQGAAIEAALRRIAEVRTLHSVSGPFDLIAVLAAELDRRAGPADRPHRRARRRRAHDLGDRAFHTHRALRSHGRLGHGGQVRPRLGRNAVQAHVSAALPRARRHRTIDTADLRVGMFVHLDLGWMSHPFALSSFRIADAGQIATIRSLGLARVRWSPEQSDAGGQRPAASRAARGGAGGRAGQRCRTARGHARDAAAACAVRDRREALRAQRAAVELCQRQYAEASRGWRQAADQALHDPQGAGQRLGALSRALVDKMLGARESLHPCARGDCARPRQPRPQCRCDLAADGQALRAGRDRPARPGRRRAQPRHRQARAAASPAIGPMTAARRPRWRCTVTTWHTV